MVKHPFDSMASDIPRPTREGRFAELAKSTHHSDELLLGPTKAICDFMLIGNIDDKRIVLAMLSEQRKVIESIDFTRVDEASNKRFLDVTRRLWKITNDTGITWREILSVMGLQKKDKKAVPIPRV